LAPSRATTRIESILEARVRAGSKLGPFLFVEFSVGFHDPGFESAQDDFGGFVEALPGFVHVDAEGFVFPQCEAPADSEECPALAEMVEHDHALGHAQGIVPRKNYSTREQPDLARLPGHI